MAKSGRLGIVTTWGPQALCALILAIAGCSAGKDRVGGGGAPLGRATEPLVNGAACLSRSDCNSGYCDNTGHCAACAADGNCVEGTVGTAGGQYCSSAGVCAARKGDGQSCAASNQCAGAGCYQARQCLNGCCDNSNVCHGYATGDKACSSGRKCDDGNACHTGGTVNTTPNPHTCTGTTNLANGSSCDPDTSVCTVDQCSAGACTHAAGNGGVTCHNASGDCDTTTSCDGATPACPSGLKPVGTVCRALSGVCDAAETCTGTSPSCPPDAVTPAGTICRAPTTSCDPAESCPGSAGYMQTLTLTNPTGGSAQTNFQVRLEILGNNTAFWSHLDGGTAATGHDIHVEDASGTELSFWIEQLDPVNQRAWIWVKVPSIAAPVSTATLTLLYGDPARVSASDITATMIFGDEFTGSSVDGTKWVIDSATGWAVSGGHLTTTNNTGRIHSITAVTTGMVLETKFKITNWNSDAAGIMVNGVRNTGDTHGDGMQPGLNLSGTQINYWNNSLWTDAFSWTGSYATTFVRSSIQVIGGTSNKSILTTWADESNSRTLTFSQNYTPTSAALMLGKRYDNIIDDGAFSADWDWALIRKFAPTPPTLIANGDEAVNPAGKNCPPDTLGDCGSSCGSCDLACQASQVSRLPVDPGEPFDIASDGTRIYWTDPSAGAIKSAALDGTGPTTLITGRPGVVGLAADDTFLYFTDVLEKSVSRIPKSGGTPQILAYEQRQPRFLVNDGDRVLWTNQGTGIADGSVRQYTKSAGRLDSLADRQQGPWTIASVAGKAYWSDTVTGTIFSRGSTTDPIQTIVTGLQAPTLASASALHVLSADGRLYDFDVTSQQLAGRATSPFGAFFLAASEPSLFWTNGFRQSVTEQLSSGAYPSTVWRRSGINVPRVVRSVASGIYFSVASSSVPGSIFTFVPDPAQNVPTGSPVCPPGHTGPICDSVTPPIVPSLECVFETTDHRLIAHFGYTNKDTRTRRVGVGPENQVDRGDGDACQPSTFAPGTHHDVFAVGFVNEVQWIVGTRSATASQSSPRCAPGAVRDTEVSP